MNYLMAFKFKSITPDWVMGLRCLLIIKIRYMNCICKE